MTLEEQGVGKVRQYVASQVKISHCLFCAFLTREFQHEPNQCRTSLLLSLSLLTRTTNLPQQGPWPSSCAR